MTAYLYQQDGKINEAVQTLEQTLARPDLSRADKETAYRFGGSLYLQVRPPDIQKAKQSYVNLLDVSPNDLTALNNMACLLAEQMTPPNPVEGKKYSERAFQIMEATNSREPLIMDTHGWLLIMSGDVDQGIDILRRVVETMPVMEAHYHLAEGYLKKAFPEEARKQLDLADAMLKRAEANKQPYDRTLKPKIDSAMQRTQEMLRSKTGTAAVGANVR
jgi:tetratricopeptide (TPR) repeat protein